MPDPTLLEKAKKLLASDLFVANTGNCPLSEKQDIFLVLSGLKPVGFVTSSHLTETGEMARQPEADDPEFVSTFLNSLGLFSLLFTDKYSTDATISLTKDNLIQLENNPDDHHLGGHLYGYPETAVQAFASEDKSLRYPEELEEKYLSDNGIPECFPHFTFSKAHFEEEILVVKKWHEFCKEYGLG